ncbi:MAG TPA: beta-ketoacyl-ACP synthase II [Longimicrobiales bacterium]
MASPVSAAGDARGARRVVVTGVGLITPVGNDVESSWSALLAGTSGAGPITHFEATEDYDVRFACEVKGFQPELYLERKEAKRMDRFAQLAIAASEQAVQSSGLLERLEALERDRIGVLIGSGIGGIATFEDQAKTLVQRGPKRISPFFVPMFIPDIAAGQVSMRYGFRGPNFCTVSACASSAHAVGEATKMIQRGDADVMIAGGTEASITALTIAGFANMKALSTRNDSPGTASRPFDATRDGFVLGEGAATLVLETLEHARARGARILAEIVGFGQSADAYHLTAPAPEGAGAQLAMRRALADGGIGVEDVQYINAHGTSTPMNDLNETLAIKAVFGDAASRLVVGSTKSMTGHQLGAAGAVEAVICALVVQTGKIPPTINFSEQDPACDLDYAHNRMVEKDVRIALSNSFGFGGHNVTLAIGQFEE